MRLHKILSEKSIYKEIWVGTYIQFTSILFLSFSLFLSLSSAHCLSLSFSLSLFLLLSLSLSIFHFMLHTNSHTLFPAHICCYAEALVSLSLTHKLYLSLSISLTHTLPFSLAQIIWPCNPLISKFPCFRNKGPHSLEKFPLSNFRKKGRELQYQNSHTTNWFWWMTQ